MNKHLGRRSGRAVPSSPPHIAPHDALSTPDLYIRNQPTREGVFLAGTEVPRVR